MSKKMLIGIGCTLIGFTFLFIICNLVANRMYEKQTIAYVEKLKSENDAKLKDANESIEKLKNEFAEISKKEQEYQQKPEEKNKEVVKESEKKENTTTQKTESNNNSTQKKEVPKEKPKNNLIQESPELLKRSNFDSMNINFWATRLYYMDMALGESESVARDMLNNATLSQLEVRKTISEYIQNLNENNARFKEVENLGVPSVCKADYQKFKNLYSQYIKSYGSMYDEKAKTYINVSTYNKCESISNQLSQVRMRMESKLK